MYDYIIINNTWKSDSIPGLELMSFKLPELLASSGKQMEFVPGELRAAEGKRQFKQTPLILDFAITAGTLSECYLAIAALNGVFYRAENIQLSDMPGYYFRGHTQQVKVVEQEKSWLRVELVFTLNPPCLNKLLGTSTQILLSNIPVCEQITESNASFNVNITTETSLHLGLSNTAYSPEIYLMLIGTWNKLQIGRLILPPVENRAVYVDADAMQAYIREEGIRTNVPSVSGEFKLANEEGKMEIKGEGLNLRAHIYAIERY